LPFNLILKGGRIIDPAQKLDSAADVAFAGGKVTAVADNISPDDTAEVRNVSGKLVVPGLIDFHTHVYWGGTPLGVDAEEIARRSGTTTFVDAGSAGAGNLAGFARHVIERSAPRILAYLNISFAGIYGFSREVMVGECSDLRLLNARECLRVAREFPGVVAGIKVRVGFNAGGSSGIAPLDIALEVAEELDLPLMAHIDFPPPGRKEILSRLRPGDILTHCYRPFPNAPIDRTKNIRAEIREAHERGVLFDVGHGYGGFSFESGRAAIAAGLTPDIISSDVHVLSKDGPAYDLLACLSKFWTLGMSLPDVIRAATETPARVLRHAELGTLGPGSAGDAAVLEIRDGDFTITDVSGEIIRTGRKLACAGTVIGGHWWADGPQ